jgi:hypothetical protein
MEPETHGINENPMTINTKIQHNNIELLSPKSGVIIWLLNRQISRQMSSQTGVLVAEILA